MARSGGNPLHHKLPRYGLALASVLKAQVCACAMCAVPRRVLRCIALLRFAKSDRCDRPASPSLPCSSPHPSACQGGGRGRRSWQRPWTWVARCGCRAWTPHPSRTLRRRWRCWSRRRPSRPARCALPAPRMLAWKRAWGCECTGARKQWRLTSSIVPAPRLQRGGLAPAAWASLCGGLCNDSDPAADRLLEEAEEGQAAALGPCEPEPGAGSAAAPAGGAAAGVQHDASGGGGAAAAAVTASPQVQANGDGLLQNRTRMAAT